MNRERLKQLKETLIWLHTVPELPHDYLFDMGTWRGQTSCGTAMCLGGWHVERAADGVLSFGCPGQGICSTECPERKSESISVLANYFDLSLEIIGRLFNPWNYWTMERRELAAIALERVEFLLAGGDYLDERLNTFVRRQQAAHFTRRDQS